MISKLMVRYSTSLTELLQPPKKCLPEQYSSHEIPVPFHTPGYKEMVSADSWMGQCLQRVLHHVRRQNARVENHLILWYNMSVNSEFVIALEFAIIRARNINLMEEKNGTVCIALCVSYT